MWYLLNRSHRTIIPLRQPGHPIVYLGNRTEAQHNEVCVIGMCQEGREHVVVAKVGAHAVHKQVVVPVPEA